MSLGYIERVTRRKSASPGHHSDDDGPALGARARNRTASDPTAGARTALELNSAAIHLLRAIQVVDRESGVAPARLSALSVLVFGGPRTLTALARAEQVAPPTMSRVVDALCDLGLVTRRPHPDHGRMVVVEATDAGREVMERARLRRAEVIGLGLTALLVKINASCLPANQATLHDVPFASSGVFTIDAGGHFSATGSGTDYSFQLSGTFNSGTASGSLLVTETAVLDGTTYQCSTGGVAWNAARQ